MVNVRFRINAGVSTIVSSSKDVVMWNHQASKKRKKKKNIENIPSSFLLYSVAMERDSLWLLLEQKAKICIPNNNASITSKEPREAICMSCSSSMSFLPFFYTSLRKEEDQYQHIHIYFFLLLQANGNVLHTHSYRKN